MTVRFGNHRLGFYVFTFALSGVILGLAANFATIFLPDYHRDFTIFVLIVPSVTILTFLIQLQWAQPQTEAISLIILSVLWLTAASWATDIIGFIQCDSLKGQSTPISGGGQTSLQSYCYKMKTIQAFSWALFCAFVIAIIILFQLVHQAQRFGRWQIWSEPIRELPWFGEMPGYYNTSYPGMQYPQSPGAYPYFPGAMPMVQPGSSIIIQPGVNGAPPTVTQVPLSA